MIEKILKGLNKYLYRPLEKGLDYIFVRKLQDISHFLPKKEISLRSLSLISVHFVFILLGVISFGFFYSFDVTDEAYHNYLHQFGIKAKTGSVLYHIFSHYIGKLFNHGVLGYRFLTLIILVCTCFFTACCVKHFIFKNMQWRWKEEILFYAFALIISLSFFVWIPSLEYNFLAVTSAALWVGVILLIINDMESNRNLSIRSFGLLLFLSLIISLAIFAKFTYGIPLLFLTPLVLFLSPLILHQKAPIVLILFSFFLPLLAFIGLCVLVDHIDPTYWGTTKNIFFGFLEHPGSHAIADLLPKYAKDIHRFIKKSYGFFIILGIILYYFYNRNKEYSNNLFIKQYHALFVLIISVLFIVLSISWSDINSLKQSLNLNSRMMIVLMALSWSYAIYLYRHKINRRYIILLWIGTIASLLTPVGTDGSYIHRVSINSVIFAVYFAVLMAFITSHFQQNRNLLFLVLISCFGIVLTIVTRQQVLQAYRSGPFRQQVVCSEHSPYLKNIRLEQDLARAIDTLSIELEAVGFDHETDRVFAYANIPGFLASLGIQAFGHNWVTTGYENSVQQACLHIGNENMKQIRQVYLLTIDEPMDEGIKECFESRLKLSNKAIKNHIGSFHDYRAREPNQRLFLIGPYYPKAD